MFEFFHRLFSSDGFMPHGHCYLWEPRVLWLHLISDALVALAYTSIPFTLLYLVRRRKDMPFNWMFLCFGTFIIACGATHLMDIWTLWTPTYWLSGLIKAITAVASVATAILLIRLVPQAIAVPTAGELSKAHDDLRLAHEELEARVQQRTAELTRKNEELAVEIAQRERAEVSNQTLREQHEVDAKFRSLLEAAPDAMVIVESTGHVVLLNAQAEKLFGYRREELLGQPIDLLVPDRSAKAHGEHRAAYFRDPKTRAMGSDLELSGRRKDGSEFAVEISLSPLDTKDGLLVSSTIRDITARRQAEYDLRHAKDVAETASRELEAFSYSVAHDLRAPLRGINGFCAALVEDAGDKLDDHAKRYLDRISAGALRMGELIDALLRLSRVSRAELAHVRVDLTRVANEIISQLRVSSPMPAIECVVADGLAAHGDPPLIRQLLENLLENAFKFVSKRASARIEVGRDLEAFFVRDNGVGFEMAYAKKLFSPFQRLHSVDEFAGTGIGLATVQRIVQRHSGRVWAEGEVDRGATFRFTLARS